MIMVKRNEMLKKIETIMVDIACLRIATSRLRALRPELVDSIAASMKSEG